MRHADFIQTLNKAYDVKCNPNFIAELLSANSNQDTATNKLLSLPLSQWTEDTGRVSKLCSNTDIRSDTLLEIHTGVNISQPGRVSLLKPNSVARLYLSDGYNVMSAILMKGLRMDLRDNIGKKILVKSTHNTVRYGMLLLRNYDILNSIEQMEVEADAEQQEQDEGLSNL